MSDLYVLGGTQKSTFRDAQQDWLLYERAVIGQVNPETGACAICLSHETPPAARASAASAVLFKSGAIAGDRLYACTSTEVMVYAVPGFRRVAYISLPFFNDLHHVRPTPHGTLAVAVTGLDMVAEITLAGEVVNCWSALGGDPWTRFSRSTDYRRCATLKPYQSHVNFTFWTHGRLWASRGDLGDAICLDDPERRIELGTRACIHDGWVQHGRIYFTSVDGHLYLVDEASLQVQSSLDLNALHPDGAAGFSWCRGVLPLDARHAWVGFTRIRPTRWKEKVRWLKTMMCAVSPPTRLALYDILAPKLLKEIPLEAIGMHAVFNALPAPPALPASEQQLSGASEKAGRA